MKLIVIFIVIAILYYYLNSNQEHFVQFAPIDWATVSKSRCQELKNEMKEIKTTLQACSVSDQVGQRDNMNNKVACIDAVNREIFNSREGASWCANADGKQTNAVELMGAQPKNMVDALSKIEVENKTVKSEVINDLLVKESVVFGGGILENNYNLLENIGFDGNDVSKMFAAY